MNETTAAIRRACSLARVLEENLDNMANQPENLYRTCDEIIRAFSLVKERISYANMLIGVGHDYEQSQQQQQQQLEAASGMQEWLRSGQAQPPLDQLLRAQAQFLGSRGAFGVHGGRLHEPVDQQEQAGGLVDIGRRDAEVPMRSRDDVQPMEAPNASRGSSSSQRQRRRRDEGEKRTERVPAPRMGNTEIPPDDGYTWRKYGQKDILHSRFPRSYFRCTHQRLYKCPAKKQVQRLDEDPNMFEVTYRGEHICHLSSTAPSVPPPSLRVRQDIIPQAATILHPPPPPPGPSSSVPLSHWLSMDIIRPSAGGTSSSCAGPSSAAPRFGDYQPVADMADVMFNSGSSSNNSMDIIFSSIDDKWDSAEKKN